MEIFFDRSKRLEIKNNTKINRIILLNFFLQLFLILGLMMRPAIASEYQVDIGWVPGFISEYNNSQTYIADSSGKIITHFGGRNAAGGGLGTGVQNSPKADFQTPSSMLVTWLSFKDGNFWQAKIALPKKEISKLLDEEIQGTFVSKPYQKVRRYDKIIVNVGPEGKVYIFLGGADTKLIGEYQGHKIDVPWETHIENTWSSSPAQSITKEQYVTRVQESSKNIIKKSEQFNEKIFHPIKWKLNLNQPKKLIAYTAKMMNGEDQTVLNNFDQITLNSIPKLFIFDVEEGKGKSRYRVTLDSDIYSFFYENFNSNDLVNFKMNFHSPNEANLYLEQGAKKVEFEKIDIEEMRM